MLGPELVSHTMYTFFHHSRLCFPPFPALYSTWTAYFGTEAARELRKGRSGSLEFVPRKCFWCDPGSGALLVRQPPWRAHVHAWHRRQVRGGSGWEQECLSCSALCPTACPEPTEQHGYVFWLEESRKQSFRQVYVRVTGSAPCT